MPTRREISELERSLTVGRALSAAVDGVPLLRTARHGTAVDEGNIGGYWDSGDVYHTYWKAGFPVASAVIKPNL